MRASKPGELLRVDLLTREYPPEVYGGAGVHLEYLARDLRRLRRRPGALLRRAARTSRASTALPGRRPGWPAPTPRCAPWASTWRWPPAAPGADLVHSHTWYANFAGHVAKLLYGVPHVVTTHSLEPLRPWKAEQLGGGYALSSWCERTAIEARRRGHRGLRRACARDVLAAYPGVDPDRVRVVYNGIDTEQYAAGPGTDVIERLGIDPSRPQRRLRRPDHPAEGPALPAARGRDCSPATRSSCCCAGAPGHPGDRGRGRGRSPTSCAAEPRRA